MTYILTVLDGHLSEDEEQAQRLEDIRHVTRCCAPGPKGEISIITAREFIAVEPKVSMPDEVAGVASHEAEDSVQGHSGTPAKRAQRKPNAIRTKDVCRDEVERSARGRSAHRTTGVCPFIVGDFQAGLLVGEIYLHHSCLDVVVVSAIIGGVFPCARSIDDFAPPQLWGFELLLFFSRARGIILVFFEGDGGIMQ